MTKGRVASIIPCFDSGKWQAVIFTKDGGRHVVEVSSIDRLQDLCRSIGIPTDNFLKVLKNFDEGISLQEAQAELTASSVNKGLLEAAKETFEKACAWAFQSNRYEPGKLDWADTMNAAIARAEGGK